MLSKKRKSLIAIMLAICFTLCASYSYSEIHRVISQKLIYVTDGDTGEQYDNPKGYARMSWVEGTTTGFFKAKAAVKISKNKKVVYRFTLTFMTDCAPSSIKGLWNVEKDGVVVCNDCIGKISVIDLPNIDEYFKLYIGDSGSYSEKWHLSGNITNSKNKDRAAKYYVDDNFSDSEDADGDNDFRHIQAAIEAASNGDVIIIERGTYKENINYLGKVITLICTNPDDQNVVLDTIIDGDDAGTVVTFNNQEGKDSVINGLVIQNGNTSIYGGGGIYCGKSSPMITNCIIRNNFTEQCGGGIFCYASSPIITNCIITNNESDEEGGGIFCRASSAPIITECTIIKNIAMSGGGIFCSSSSPIITNCIIKGNSVQYLGGGLSLSASHPTIADSIISSNNAAKTGGAIYCYNDSFPKVIDNTIVENSAYECGTIFWCGDPEDISEYIYDNTISDNIDTICGKCCYPPCSLCDNRPITGEISPSISTLWPPNHKMIPVTINIDDLVLHNPDTDIRITDVTISEYSKNKDYINDNTSDYEITGDLSLNLRSTRTKASLIRVYYITVTATDCSGSYTFITKVIVPHNKNMPDYTQNICDDIECNGTEKVKRFDGSNLEFEITCKGESNWKIYIGNCDINEEPGMVELGYAISCDDDLLWAKDEFIISNFAKREVKYENLTGDTLKIKFKFNL